MLLFFLIKYSSKEQKPVCASPSDAFQTEWLTSPGLQRHCVNCPIISGRKCCHGDARRGHVNAGPESLHMNAFYTKE